MQPALVVVLCIVGALVAGLVVATAVLGARILTVERIDRPKPLKRHRTRRPGKAADVVATRSAFMDHCDLVIDLMVQPKFWSSCVSDRHTTMEQAVEELRHPRFHDTTVWIYYPLPVLHQNYAEFLRLLPADRRVRLVSNHGDEPLEPDALQVLAADPRIEGLYVNNVPMSFRGHPKVHFIPIGYCQDRFHHVRRGPFLVTVALQRVPLVHRLAKNHPQINVLQCTPTRPLRQKALKVLCSVGSTGSEWTSLTLRRECRAHLSQQPFGVVTGFLEKSQYYAMHEDVAFECSPFGNGIDCFRTYEALLLHTIPIVFHSPCDAVYKDLPVVIVRRPEEINEKLLADAMARYGDWFETHDVRSELDVRRWLQ